MRRVNGEVILKAVSLMQDDETSAGISRNVSYRIRKSLVKKSFLFKVLPIVILLAAVLLLQFYRVPNAQVIDVALVIICIAVSVIGEHFSKKE